MKRNDIIDSVYLKVRNEEEYKQVAQILDKYNYLWNDFLKYTEWSPYRNGLTEATKSWDTVKSKDTIFLFPAYGYWMPLDNGVCGLECFKCWSSGLVEADADSFIKMFNSPEELLVDYVELRKKLKTYQSFVDRMKKVLDEKIPPLLIVQVASTSPYPQNCRNRVHYF